MPVSSAFRMPGRPRDGKVPMAPAARHVVALVACLVRIESFDLRPVNWMVESDMAPAGETARTRAAGPPPSGPPGRASPATPLIVASRPKSCAHALKDAVVAAHAEGRTSPSRGNRRVRTPSSRESTLALRNSAQATRLSCLTVSTIASSSHAASRSAMIRRPARPARPGQAAEPGGRVGRFGRGADGRARGLRPFRPLGAGGGGAGVPGPVGSSSGAESAGAEMTAYLTRRGRCPLFQPFESGEQGLLVRSGGRQQYLGDVSSSRSRARWRRASGPGRSLTISAARASPAWPNLSAWRAISSSPVRRQVSSPLAAASAPRPGRRVAEASSRSIAKRCGSWPPSITGSTAPNTARHRGRERVRDLVEQAAVGEAEQRDRTLVAEAGCSLQRAAGRGSTANRGPTPRRPAPPAAGRTTCTATPSWREDAPHQLAQRGGRTRRNG